MSVLRNLNFIKNVAYFPCQDPDPLLIIQAAAGAAAPVILEAATFGCLDILRLRAGISPWHARGLRALINGINSPIEQDRINGIYKFVIPAEKLLFFFFVVDLTLEFLALFHSQIFQLGACGPKPRTCHWSGTVPVWAATTPNVAHTVSYFGMGDGAPCPPNGTFEFSVPRGWYWSGSFSLTPRAAFHGLDPSSVTTYYEIIDQKSITTEPQISRAPWFGNSFTAINKSSGRNRQGVDQTIRMWASADQPALAISGSASFTVSEEPFLDADIIPVNCLGVPLHQE